MLFGQPSIRGASESASASALLMQNKEKILLSKWSVIVLHYDRMASGRRQDVANILTICLCVWHLGETIECRSVTS